MSIEEREARQRAFGRRLHAARWDARLDQQDIAEACDVSRQLVGRWERGTSTPDVVELAAIAQRVGRPVGWLVADVIDLTDEELGASGWTPLGSDDPYREGGPFDPALVTLHDDFDDHVVDLRESSGPIRASEVPVRGGCRSTTTHVADAA